MSDLILRQADIDRFTSTLDKLISNANISLSVLIHRDGHLLASAGNTQLLDTTALSALVSASFSSMIAVANLIGEQEFATQHLAGREKSVYISLADEYTFVVSVFDIKAPLEPIRSHTEEYREELADALMKLYNNEPEPLPSGDDFEEATSGVHEEEDDEVVDAEEAARREKAGAGSAGKAVPRKLSYTGKAADKDADKDGGAARVRSTERPKIREPDADDADLEALANAITSRKERDKHSTGDGQTKSAPQKESDQIIVDGKPMNVVSLKAKSGKPHKSKK